MSKEDCPIHSENPDAEWRSLKPGTIVEFDSKALMEDDGTNKFEKYDGLKGIIVRPLGCHEDLAGLFDYVISWDWKDERYVQFMLDLKAPEDKETSGVFKCTSPVTEVTRLKLLLDPRIPGCLIRVNMACNILANIAKKLAQDEEDSKEDGSNPPSDAAKETCLKLANDIVEKIGAPEDMMVGVFTEDSGGISLTGRSYDSIIVKI